MGLLRGRTSLLLRLLSLLIHDMDFPMCFWVEACNTTMYILNRCPHRILKDMTPKEAFTGVKLDVSHFMCVWLSSLYSCA
jgi:hypothetical protein